MKRCRILLSLSVLASLALAGALAGACAASIPTRGTSAVSVLRLFGLPLVGRPGAPGRGGDPGAPGALGSLDLALIDGGPGGGGAAGGPGGPGIVGTGQLNRAGVPTGVIDDVKAALRR